MLQGLILCFLYNELLELKYWIICSIWRFFCGSICRAVVSLSEVKLASAERICLFIVVLIESKLYPNIWLLILQVWSCRHFFVVTALWVCRMAHIWYCWEHDFLGHLRFPPNANLSIDLLSWYYDSQCSCSKVIILFSLLFFQPLNRFWNLSICN